MTPYKIDQELKRIFGVFQMELYQTLKMKL